MGFDTHHSENLSRRIFNTANSGKNFIYINRMGANAVVGEIVFPPTVNGHFNGRKRKSFYNQVGMK